MLVSVVILVTSSIAYVSATSICPSEIRNCSCTDNRLNCDLKGYHKIAENISVDLDMLYFSFERNNISLIGDNHFKNFIKMSHISLRQNKITEISEKAFYHNTQLHTIDLSSNKLKSIPKDLFKRLSFLQTLYLQHNKLKRIESEHLTHNIALERFRVNNNELNYVAKDAFVNCGQLFELYLEINKLEIPQKDWLTHFKHSGSSYELYMDDNPWSCDCRMKEFYEWAQSNAWFLIHSGSGVSVPECFEPIRLRGYRIASVRTSDEFTCTPVNITSPTNDVRVVEGSRLQLDCQSTGFPPAVVSISHGKDTLSTDIGSTFYIFLKPETSDTGIYHCRAAGFNEHAENIVQEYSINVTVYQNPTSSVTVVLVCLFFVGVALGSAVYIYKKKFGSTARYGRLPSTNAYYDTSAVAASAKYNADSIRDPLGRRPAPSSVKNPYKDDSADDDDVTEYSKDTEFLV